MRHLSLYPECKPWELEPHYSAHVTALTEAGLESKGAIAEQLAWRDRRIAELEAELDDAWRNDHPITNAEALRRARAQVELCEAIERPEQERCCHCGGPYADCVCDTYD